MYDLQCTIYDVQFIEAEFNYSVFTSFKILLCVPFETTAE